MAGTRERRRLRQASLSRIRRSKNTAPRTRRRARPESSPMSGARGGRRPFPHARGRARLFLKTRPPKRNSGPVPQLFLIPCQSLVMPEAELRAPPPACCVSRGRAAPAESPAHDRPFRRKKQVRATVPRPTDTRGRSLRPASSSLKVPAVHARMKTPWLCPTLSPYGSPTLQVIPGMAAATAAPARSPPLFHCPGSLIAMLPGSPRMPPPSEKMAVICSPEFPAPLTAVRPSLPLPPHRRPRQSACLRKLLFSF